MAAAQDFLVEIGTEELPPKALRELMNAFADGIRKGLEATGLNFGALESFAAPRRLAVRVSGLVTHQPDRKVERRGPAMNAAFDASGNPTKALEGFARSCGVPVDQLEPLKTDKGSWLVFRTTEAGQATTSLLPGIVRDSLAQLPIPKRMRWGARRVEFVRPAHWVVMLFGSHVVPAEVLGLTAGNQTRGHRFHAPGAITLTAPSQYETVLREQGKVIASFDERRQLVNQAVQQAAKAHGATAVIDPELLDEVTALNEWPVPLVGRFEERFLAVPNEALISSMKGHQKYFHMVDGNGRMLPNFITIANIESRDPAKVIAGNERVIRPRLTDATFFFETDRKQTQAQRVESLRPIVFQEKLGSLYDKCSRISRVAAQIAAEIGADAQLASRAGLLTKADLVSAMVLEFPELQGIMGMYYARHDGEAEEVAMALDEQYLPRFAGDRLPTTRTGCAVALADRLDTLTGLFGIKQPPTGTKDPFALRRAALGVLRIMIENGLSLDLQDCIRWSAAQHNSLTEANVVDVVVDYTLERLRAWYDEAGVPVDVYLAVHARRPTRPVDFDHRIKAVATFRALPEATALAAANKRVANLLDKEKARDLAGAVNKALLTEPAEVALCEAIAQLEAEVSPLFDAGEYSQGLARLASLRAAVDGFFDEVLVMADDELVRRNRLALLNRLRDLFLRVADISLLQSASS